MHIARFIAQATAVSAIVLLAGCASVNKAPAQADAKAKLFQPNPATSQIYVYRNETLGSALSMPVTINGKLAGNTGPHSYFKFDLPAGSHTITSQGTESTLTVTTELGKLYYVWQEVKMGAFSGGSKLQLVTEDVGRKGVAESTLIQPEF
jgi:hypothetical protein